MIPMKALIPSTILTLMLSAAVGACGYTGTYLKLDSFRIGQHAVYWSWSFFVFAMALFSVMAMQAREVRS
jgi:hypothetical protein